MECLVPSHFLVCCASTCYEAGNVEEEFPFASHDLLCAFHVHGKNTCFKGVLGQTPRHTVVTGASCSVQARALRSPLVASGPRRSDAVGDREVFESYMRHMAHMTTSRSVAAT